MSTVLVYVSTRLASQAELTVRPHAIPPDGATTGQPGFQVKARRNISASLFLPKTFFHLF